MLSIVNQIVVATEQLRLVAGALEAAGLRPARTAHNQRLGLTLVDLDADVEGLQAAAEALLDGVPEESRTQLTGPVEEGLDQLLAALRDRFRHRYSGWTPTMGKNRLMHGIELLPYASVLGFDLPVPADRPDGVQPGRPAVPVTDVPLCPVRVGIIDVQVAEHRRIEGGYLTDPGGLDLAPAAPGVRQGWQGHATFIANLVLTAAPSAELVVRTALEQQRVDPGCPGDLWRMPLWRLAERLVEFADAGVQVLNCSLGCETRNGQPPLVLERAIAHLSPTMAVVAAAGNHGLPSLPIEPYLDVPVRDDPSAALFPAALDGVLAVGVREPDGRVADFNPRGADDGEWAPWIDGFLPGRDVVSAYLGDRTPEPVELPPAAGTTRPRRETFGGWARWTGSSFAAAHATGRIAALIAAGRSPAQAVQEIREDEEFWRR